MVSVLACFGRACFTSQINVGEKVDRVQTFGYHEASAGVLEGEAIESAAVLTTVPLNQVPFLSTVGGDTRRWLTYILLSTPACIGEIRVHVPCVVLDWE